MATNNTATSISTSAGGSALFKGLKTPRQLLNYNLMRGVTDFSNLQQWDLYEKGYPFLVVVSIPQFLADLRDKDQDGIGLLIDNYVHILENDFRGIDNIDNITGDSSGEITNGIRSISVINKVMKPTNSNFSMTYYERSGSVLTKGNELYLTGIKDPDTQVKTYHGLIDDWVFNGISSISGKDPGYHQECFTFMYFVTDNTMTKVERAFLIAGVQPTQAAFSDLYTGNKGDISFVELNMPFNGFFINNDFVYQKAEDMLLAMRNPKNTTASRIIVDSNNFKYSAIAGAGFSRSNDAFSTPEFWNYKNGNVGPTKRDAMEETTSKFNVHSRPSANGANMGANAYSTGANVGGSSSTVTNYKGMVTHMSKNGGLEHATDYMRKQSSDGNSIHTGRGNQQDDADINRYSSGS